MIRYSPAASLRCVRIVVLAPSLLLASVLGPVAIGADAGADAATLAVSAPASFAQLTNPDASESRPADPPLWRQIDEAVAKNHRGPIAPQVDDATFLRRVYLDLIGRSPTVAESRSFLDASAADEQAGEGDDAGTSRREKLIDALLGRPEFAEHYASVLDVLFMERRTDKHVSTQAWREFLKQWLADKRPLDELCREILAADGTGGDALRPAAKFYLDRGVEHNLITRDVGRVFFGRNMQCAQCHDHPIVDDYLQSEYYGIQAFLSRSYLFEDAQQGAVLGEKADGRPEFTSVFLREKGASESQLVLPSAMAMDVEPHFAGEADAYLVEPAQGVRSVPRFSLRHQLAVLATHPKSESFSRNFANRMWAHMLGLGVVHPVDFHHSDNPPASAELMHVLTDHFVALRYDLRALLKQIALSETYQRSVSLPPHEAWVGPAFERTAVEAELAEIAQRLERLGEDEKALGKQMEQAERAVSAAQADVAIVQQEIDSVQQAYLKSLELREQKQKHLSDMEAKRQTQQEIAAALTAAAQHSEKAAQQLSEDKDLAASHALLVQRAAALAESLKGLEAEIEQAKAALAAAVSQADGQRSRVAGLGSRRVALGEFVTEARGVHRVLQVRRQRLVDQQGDSQRQQQLVERRLEFVDLRDELQKVSQAASDKPAAENDAAENDAAELALKLKYAAESLQQEWVRAYAARPMRGLSPEQLANATFSALEGEARARISAAKAWEEANKENLQLLADATAREAQLKSTVQEARSSFQGEFVDRFGSPAGAPQDSFYAAADQALFMLNDATVQEWLQPIEGSLVHRLQGIVDANELAQAMYWAVFSRDPDEEERAVVREYLAGRGEARLAAVQELVWGMLTSAEFRFMP